MEKTKEDARTVGEREVSVQRKGARFTMKDSNGKEISCFGSVLHFQILLDGAIELMKGETYTICVEEVDK